MEQHRMVGRTLIQPFVMGGNAYFTVVNPATGTRYTFRVSQRVNDDGTKTPFFVSVLTGPDNEHSYSYLGTMWPNGSYNHGRKSRISQEAKSAQCFKWLAAILQSEDADQKLSRIEFWHEGRCGKCGRKLTVPSSIESGIGPVCEEKGL